MRRRRSKRFTKRNNKSNIVSRRVYCPHRCHIVAIKSFGLRIDRLEEIALSGRKRLHTMFAIQKRKREQAAKHCYLWERETEEYSNFLWRLLHRNVWFTLRWQTKFKTVFAIQYSTFRVYTSFYLLHVNAVWWQACWQYFEWGARDSFHGPLRTKMLDWLSEPKGFYLWSHWKPFIWFSWSTFLLALCNLGYLWTYWNTSATAASKSCSQNDN